MRATLENPLNKYCVKAIPAEIKKNIKYHDIPTEISTTIPPTKDLKFSFSGVEYYPLGVFDLATDKFVIAPCVKLRFETQHDMGAPDVSIGTQNNGVYWFKAVKGHTAGKLRCSISCLEFPNIAVREVEITIVNKNPQKVVPVNICSDNIAASIPVLPNEFVSPEAILQIQPVSEQPQQITSSSSAQKKKPSRSAAATEEVIDDAALNSKVKKSSLVDTSVSSEVRTDVVQGQRRSSRSSHSVELVSVELEVSKKSTEEHNNGAASDAAVSCRRPTRSPRLSLSRSAEPETSSTSLEDKKKLVEVDNDDDASDVVFVGRRRPRSSMTSSAPPPPPLPQPLPPAKSSKATTTPAKAADSQASSSSSSKNRSSSRKLVKNDTKEDNNDFDDQEEDDNDVQDKQTDVMQWETIDAKTVEQLNKVFPFPCKVLVPRTALMSSKLGDCETHRFFIKGPLLEMELSRVLATAVLDDHAQSLASLEIHQSWRRQGKVYVCPDAGATGTCSPTVNEILYRVQSRSSSLPDVDRLTNLLRYTLEYYFESNLLYRHEKQYLFKDKLKRIRNQSLHYGNEFGANMLMRLLIFVVQGLNNGTEVDEAVSGRMSNRQSKVVHGRMQDLINAVVEELRENAHALFC